MAYTVADRTLIEKRVAAILEANGDGLSYAAASLTDQETYHPDEIRDAILETDAEFCQFIIETVGQGFRGQFLQASSDQTDGASLASRPGPLDVVEIKYADNSYKPGILVSSIDFLLQLKANPENLYGAAVTEYEGRYGFLGNKIYFVGSAARILVPKDFAIDRTTFLCQAPDIYTGGIVSGTIPKLIKPGMKTDPEGYLRHFTLCEQRIRSGAMTIPVLSQAIRQGAA